MKILLIAIGFFLMLGGALSIIKPHPAMVFTSGPSQSSRFGKSVIDNMSEQRYFWTGISSGVIGLGFLLSGVYWKELSESKDKRSH